MKKAFLIFILLLFSVSFAQELKGSIESYSNLLQHINLTEEQKVKILKIRLEEENVIKPYILDVCAKEDGLETLKNFKCDFFDKKCKTKLKESIEERELEQTEALRKIDQKKRYYEIRYRNVLTREQDLEFQRIKNLTEQQERAFSDTQKRIKRQQRIDKMKVWRKMNIKLPEIKIPEIKYINPKGVETGF